MSEHAHGGGSQRMGNGPSELREWAVSSSHAVATEAGAAVLRAGGNAVDAAAAVQSTLGVVEPLASGLGGGAFWVIFAANEMRTYALDARETAPAAATPDIFLGRDGEPLDENERAASGLAVAVPGALLGLEEVLRQFGTISLTEALQPAIRAANKGVPVSAFMTSRIGLGSANNRARLSRSPAAATMFLPGGTPLREGHLLVQRELGQTLETLAERGSGELYRGTIGKAIVDEIRARGGRMTLDDLSAYRAVWRTPLSRPYGAHEIVTFGPPGSGVSLLAMLSMLETLRAERPWRNENEAAHILAGSHALHVCRSVRDSGRPGACTRPGDWAAGPRLHCSALFARRPRSSTAKLERRAIRGHLSRLTTRRTSHPPAAPGAAARGRPRTSPPRTAGATWSQRRRPSSHSSAAASWCPEWDCC